ncbi:hypothetical protein DQ04_00081060 [Trypanosoma grayi]|uniref:hypothetical protein n=1 Tax=Trypanosoma grayi TaxID=71804 RepID=UPI0004F4B03A|nr:hypothetical protein DQ04_00081060 [Trypanosoma grayi]KEG15407.1 hypothetical protein DQ04_00081060 [Trypanosoma grayi]
MNFVIVDGSWPVAPCVLPRSRLLAHAVKDASDGGDSARLVIQGRTLLTLCQQLVDAVAVKTKSALDLTTLALAVLRDLHDDPLSAVCLVTPKCVHHHMFALEDLVGSARLVVFTSRWESLSSAAALSRAKTARKKREESPSATRRRVEKSGSDSREVSGSRPSPLPGRGTTGMQKSTRAETYFTKVGLATQSDLDAVNRLLLAGTIQLDPRMESFLCTVCGRLPRQTVTASCCGAVLCAGCAPMPLNSSLSSVLSERSVCGVCGETPLTAPETQTSRDAEVMRLVRELRVLYHPQLSAAACHDLPEKEPSRVPFVLQHAGVPPPLCDMSGQSSKPVLGPIFPSPS